MRAAVSTVERTDGHTGAMSGNPRHVPPPGPAPVSVHDDGDMLGKPRRIEPQVNFSFFLIAVHSSRNRMSQAELSESKLTHEILCVQCDGCSDKRRQESAELRNSRNGRIQT